jgi:hypothetical protein
MIALIMPGQIPLQMSLSPRALWEKLKSLGRGSQPDDYGTHIAPQDMRYEPPQKTVADYDRELLDIAQQRMRLESQRAAAERDLQATDRTTPAAATDAWKLQNQGNFDPAQVVSAASEPLAAKEKINQHIASINRDLDSLRRREETLVRRRSWLEKQQSKPQQQS